MDVFENISEQAEAKRLLRAALADEGPAHAYLFYGPAGVGTAEPGAGGVFLGTHGFPCAARGGAGGRDLVRARRACLS